ncbi:hypothetical protein [Streptomyces fructofermentans]|uniref:Lipoprotein n=1 Tax=Streptomyces fructofermentans TaxID=152141 RepID=A0A918NNE2_9ACTN|nr:hypothetical protein [Streptomyces fructofermentans]GGX82786.1 hypothetical protein GCM10010515_57980 [Streptomyces fructofermentans]
MKGSPGAALLVGLAAAITLTGCGVPPSDVIQAGEPAGGMLAPDPRASAFVSVPLYFLDEGVLTAYPREFRDPVDLGTVVRQLFGGPTTSEAATATTELPRLTDAPDVQAGSGKSVGIGLPRGVAPLSRPAMLQLACTVAYVGGAVAAQPSETREGTAPAAPPVQARRSPAHTSVQVFGDGWTLTQSAKPCPDLPQP